MKVKSQVMSNIVRMLENEGPFKDVIYVILGKCIKVSENAGCHCYAV